MKNKRYFWLLPLIVWLSGCTVEPATVENPLTFQPDSKVRFNGKTFQRGKTLDLIEMVRYVYNPNGDSTSREKVTLFFDKNKQGLSLQQRLELRQRSYQQSENTLADLNIDQQTLYSMLIYRPSRQFSDWGVELSKGKNIDQCGFLEFQYSYSVNGKAQPKAQEAAFLARKIYPRARQHLTRLQQQPWQWQCQ